MSYLSMTQKIGDLCITHHERRGTVRNALHRKRVLKPTAQNQHFALIHANASGTGNRRTPAEGLKRAGRGRAGVSLCITPPYQTTTYGHLLPADLDRAVDMVGAIAREGK